MKCSTMVYTVCKGKKDLKTKEYNIFFSIFNLTPLDMYSGLSQVDYIKALFCLFWLLYQVNSYGHGGTVS